MYQVSSSWLLHDIPAALDEESRLITLRGYIEEFIRLPGDFAWRTPLSVDDIASDICPARKDLYNDKARGLTGRQKNGRITWGRHAGVIAESYCTGLLGVFDDLYAENRKVAYQTLIDAVEEYSNDFFSNRKEIRKRMRELESIAAEEGLNRPEHLRLVLEYSARNELAFLGADWILGEVDGQEVQKLTERVPIAIDKGSLRIHPKAEFTGINDPATPDFVMGQVNAVGDVKSGKDFKRSHQLTCAGYALARESELGPDGDTNIGIIYFFETHGPVPIPGRAYFFVITDLLRRVFVDRRNNAYNVLSQSLITGQPPDISSVNRDECCIHCKFLELCDHDRGQ